MKKSFLRKMAVFVLLAVMTMTLTACGTKAGWKEQYDLGMKYVSEAKYEEAVLAFNKALEIDPKQAPVYIALAEVYTAQGNYTQAATVLTRGVQQAEDKEPLEQALQQVADKRQQAGQPLPVQLPDKTPRPQDGPQPQQGGISLRQPAGRCEDVEGVVRTERIDDPDGSHTVYGYDSSGRRIAEYIHPDEDNLYAANICTYLSDSRYREDYYYTDLQNNFILEQYRVYDLDEYGRDVRCEFYTADGVMEQYRTDIYDEKGLRVRSDFYTPDGEMTQYVVYTYHSDGTWNDMFFHRPDGSPLD